MSRINIFITATFLCLLVVSNVAAQVDEHKFEVGGVFTSITLNDFQGPAPGVPAVDKTINGLGGRLAYNLSEHIAIDGEASFFPKSHFFNDEFGQKMQGFIGVKAGARTKRVGLFAKARPGIMWFGDFSSRGSCSPTPFGSVCGVAHEKDFALDLGGVLEFYPAERAIIRLDAGDTIIRISRDRRESGFPACRRRPNTICKSALDLVGDSKRGFSYVLEPTAGTVLGGDGGGGGSTRGL